MNEAAALARTLERAVTYRGSKGPTALPAGVRVAGIADEPAIWELLMMEAREHAMVPISLEKVAATMRRGTRPNDAGGREGVVGLISSPDGQIVASVGIGISQPWYADIWCCEEVWSFVHPDHRKAKEGHAKRLIDFSKWWAESLNMPLIMAVFSNERTIGKVRMYARHMPFVGGFFLHLPPGFVVAEGK